MEIAEIEAAARKYALKILGLNENQIVSSEIERQVGKIVQNFIAGAKWFEENLRSKAEKGSGNERKMDST